MSTVQPETGLKRFISKHRGSLFVALLLGLMLLFQWPMLKGSFYRMSGSAAPDDHIPWRSDLDAALAEARQTGKPVLVSFWAIWCPSCQVMKHDAWPDAQVGQLASQDYIPVAVDADRNVGAAERYGVSAVPTILVLSGDGEVMRQANYLSRNGLLAFLRRAGSQRG